MHTRIWLVLLLSVQFSIGQKFEPGKVTVKDLEIKQHPNDSSAVAAVLYNKGMTKFNYSEARGFTVEHTFEMRIKIYKKEGLQYANYEVPYYIGYENLNPDVLDITDAVTYNLVNGKVEKTKIGNEGKFREKVSKNWKTATITLPNVKVGSIIEFRYKLKSEDLMSFPTFVFQRNIPVDFVEYTTEIPVMYGYKQVLQGLFKGIASKSIVEHNAINFNNSTTARTDALEFSQVTTTFTGKDIAALKLEEFVDNIENYRSAVDYELEVIREKEEQDNKNFSKTWEDVAQKIYKRDEFGKQLQRTDYFEAELRQLINGIQDHDEKVKVIYDYVKLKMNWNGEFGYLTDKGVQKAWLDRTGNDAEINFILIAMLNAAGVVAYPVLVSTVENGIPVYPNQTSFNYVVASCNFNEKRILMDACTKKAPPGILPLYALNWNGRLIAKDGNSEEIDMHPPSPSKNNTTIVAALDMQGHITGQVRLYKTDYDAFVFRQKYAGTNREQYLEYLENNFNKISISDYTIENEQNLMEPVKESFNFSSDGLVETIGARMYLNPSLFLQRIKNAFTSEDRQLPVFFGYPKQSRIVINLQVPEGYAVESIPQPIAVATPENVAAFKYEIKEMAGKIQVSITSEINMMLVSQDFYPVLKDFFQKVADKQNEKIVLKKI
ncbi:DUF3857 domain-containing protein [Flavobacterium pallidum]|uniref:DUF3857 domain-containing protein n=1 Tax=Flavobacterium pallidum TaxID=2172098 RepID=A0A2S1SGJ6_9FLAO|nr:DUF3857 domain-containing protein [Flavobacterium pallidum]AWI25520.1 hypothetical protein HYN49_06200 [Flavobacterium pallidum]